MKRRKVIPYVLVLVLLFSTLNSTTFAVDSDDINMCSPSVKYENGTLRSGGSFSTNVPANTLKVAGSAISLQSGDWFTIDATYTPSIASVDFGFIAPDGLFYPVNTTSGSINTSIELTQSGNYIFAIRNHYSSGIYVHGTLSF